MKESEDLWGSFSLLKVKRPHPIPLHEAQNLRKKVGEDIIQKFTIIAERPSMERKLEALDVMGN